MSSIDPIDNGSERTLFCTRSADSYPKLLAAQLGANLDDATCQGATTGDVLVAYESDDGQPLGQIDELDPSTALVTVTIGANDVAFGGPSGCDPRDRIPADPEFNPELVPGQEESDPGVAAVVDSAFPGLAQGNGDAGASESNGQPLSVSACYDQVIADNNDALAQLPAKLDGVYAAIATRAPSALVVATGYLPVLLDGDSCEAIDGMDPAELQWYQETTDKLNAVVEAQARAHGALYVMPPMADEHTACASPDQRWTSLDGVETDSFPGHPTPLGHEAMANALVDAIRNTPKGQAL